MSALARAPPVYPACNQDPAASASTLGTSVGWSDIYPADYDRQWVRRRRPARLLRVRDARRPAEPPLRGTTATARPRARLLRDGHYTAAHRADEDRIAVYRHLERLRPVRDLRTSRAGPPEPRIGSAGRCARARTGPLKAHWGGSAGVRQWSVRSRSREDARRDDVGQRGDLARRPPLAQDLHPPPSSIAARSTTVDGRPVSSPPSIARSTAATISARRPRRSAPAPARRCGWREVWKSGHIAPASGPVDQAHAEPLGVLAAGERVAALGVGDDQRHRPGQQRADRVARCAGRARRAARASPAARST